MPISFTTAPPIGSEAPALYDLYTDPLSGFSSPYSFSFRAAATTGPFLYNVYPAHGSLSVDGNVDISMYIIDRPNKIQENTIKIYIDGSEIFDGSTETFYSPWNGVGSYITPISIDGYDGYYIALKHTETIPSVTKKIISVTALNNKGLAINFGRTDPSLTPNPYWFRTGAKLFSFSIGNYEIYFDMEFSDAMDTSTLLNPVSYKFDNGLYVSHAELISSSLVRLWVENFYGTSTFNMSDFSSILDQYGNAIPSSYASSVSATPFQSTADITSTNNLIRTWHEANVVQTDSQRAYFGTTKGIDVFKRIDENIVVKWAYILDGYNVGAMFVANFGGDLVITDTAAPYLTNLNPISGGSILSTGTIYFRVADLTTAPDISTVTIYVNTTLAFSGGYSGSRNGYIVTAEPGYKLIDFSLKSETVFSGPTITIRIVASDIVGNELDTSYTLNVI